MTPTKQQYTAQSTTDISLVSKGPAPTMWWLLGLMRWRGSLLMMGRSGGDRKGRESYGALVK
eukprot:CAMPEP_0118649704 /NCGR_PEP_ID=MMETSP0785-20121206/9843_1 /TAXON_ID=91992 /ORGANISM="Bolidomonas pacifica, Strain CCMP 1866" /LENGTH=61 /DNA_ID=CAMNT_0006542005 /DNA_START=358 /DNA_END=543 /DNA_ORIENTATION=-